MGRKKRVPTEDRLLRTLDPKWATRVPDGAFSIKYLTSPMRFIRIDLKDDGIETALSAEFRRGEEPRVLCLYGNKEIMAFDFFERPVKPIKYQIETSRTRNSASDKSKLISVVPGVPGTFSINPGHVFEACDTVVALDTNSSPKLLGGDNVSVLGVAIAEKVALQYPKLVRIKGRYAAEFRNFVEPKEKFGWAIGLRELYSCDMLDVRSRVAVIVDAFANELPEMNNGAEIVPGYSLPANARLIYASADTAQMSGINKCIRMADRISSIVMSQLFKSPLLETVVEGGIPGICTAARFWRIEEEGGRLHMLTPTVSR